MAEGWAQQLLHDDRTLTVHLHICCSWHTLSFACLVPVKIWQACIIADGCLYSCSMFWFRCNNGPKLFVSCRQKGMFRMFWGQLHAGVSGVWRCLQHCCQFKSWHRWHASIVRSVVMLACLEIVKHTAFIVFYYWGQVVY